LELAWPTAMGVEDSQSDFALALDGAIDALMALWMVP
jgi:hypothetical protein